MAHVQCRCICRMWNMKGCPFYGSNKNWDGGNLPLWFQSLKVTSQLALPLLSFTLKWTNSKMAYSLPLSLSLSLFREHSHKLRLSRAPLHQPYLWMILRQKTVDHQAALLWSNMVCWKTPSSSMIFPLKSHLCWGFPACHVRWHQTCRIQIREISRCFRFPGVLVDLELPLRFPTSATDWPTFGIWKQHCCRT